MMKSFSISRSIRQRVDNPFVLDVSRKIYFLCTFYNVSRSEFLERFVLPFVKSDANYKRIFEALISTRYTQDQEFPTRGKQKDRDGTIHTITHELFQAMKKSLPKAEKKLNEEFLIKREESFTSADKQPRKRKKQ